MVRWIRRLVVAALVLMGLAGGVVSLVADVRAGRGLEYYFTATGVKMNAISALVIVALVAPAFLVAAAVAWWRDRRQRG